MTDIYYSPPAIERDRRAGDLLRIRPSFVPLLPRAGGAWQIVYLGTNSRGGVIPVSGIVILPETDTTTGHAGGSGSCGLLVFCPPFRGLGGRSVSQQLVLGDEPGAETDTAAIAAALEQGWVVAVPDGEGLGVDAGPHTFLASRAAGQIALDLARAAQGIPDLDTIESEVPVMPVTMWGYADGGRAVVAAGELHQRYAPELDLRGICAGAVVSDLAALGPATSDGIHAALGMAALVGLSRAYPHLALERVLTREGQQVAVEAGTLTSAELYERVRGPLAHWCRREDPWCDPVWQQVLAYEVLAHTATLAPLHLYHGHNDRVVPVRAGLRTLIAHRQRGTNVTWREYDAGHAETHALAVRDVLARLAENLTHTPHPGPGTDTPAPATHP
ncbi:lipase family protein [Nocardia macrotermitis]|uniref:Putative inactive lipase n=1 Tax=Nocardia macrotermitis TaxID=2585198 RepID=A0A7K0DB41_9NOCA|nr:lipase family protein [Nocardia macrotermitis]MQY23013.1 putative inactive lipase [Nocardia macrotermitis]